MNIKKVVFSVIAAATTALTVGSMSAFAYTVVTTNDYRHTDNVQTEEYKYVGNFANHYAKIQDTAIASTNASYNGSYKYANYIQFGESNGNLYRIYEDEADGTSSTILTDPHPVSSEVAKRRHDTELHYTSNPSSTVKETFTAVITKP